MEFNNLPNKVRQKESDGIMGQGFPPTSSPGPQNARAFVLEKALASADILLGV